MLVENQSPMIVPSSAFQAALVGLVFVLSGHTTLSQLAPATKNRTTAGSSLNWALHFSRTTDAVNILGSTEIEGDMTIEAIVAFDRTGTRDGLFIEDWVQEGDTPAQKNFGVSPAGVHGYAFPRDFEAGYFRLPTQLELNRWHHVAFVVDGKEFERRDENDKPLLDMEGRPLKYTKQRIYINGQLVGERETSTEQISESITSCLLGFGWTGYLSSFRISNFARYKGASHPPIYTKLSTDRRTLLLYNISSDPKTGLLIDESGNNRTGRLGAAGKRTPNPTSPAYVLFGPDLSVDSDKDGITDYRESIDGTDINDRKSFDPSSRRLVAHYTLDGSLSDTTGFGRGGTIVAGTDNVRYSSGVNEGSLNLAGDAVVQVPVSYAPFTSGSIALWIRRSQEAFIYLHLEDGSKKGLSFGWGWRQGHEKPGLWVKKSGRRAQWQGPYFTDGVEIARNLWTHVALSVSRTGQLTAYVNGKKTGNFRIRGGVPWAGVPKSATLHLLGDGKKEGALGRLDDIRVYSRTLSALEVRKMFSSSNPDTDGDGLLDRYETNTGVFVSLTDTGTDPNKADTTGDGVPDGWAVNAKIDPNRDYSKIVEFVQQNPSLYNLFSEEDFLASFPTGREEGRQAVISGPRPYNLMRLADLPPALPSLRIELPVGTPVKISVPLPPLPLQGDWTRFGLSADPVAKTSEAEGTVEGRVGETTTWQARLLAYQGAEKTRALLVVVSPFGGPTIPQIFASRKSMEMQPLPARPPTPKAVLRGDRDGDGLPDNVETNTGIYRSPSDTGTNPDKADTNSDGVPDGLAVGAGLNPFLNLSGIIVYIKSNSNEFNLRTNAEYRESLLEGRAQGKADVLEQPLLYGLTAIESKPLPAEWKIQIPPNTPFILQATGDWSRYEITSNPNWLTAPSGTIQGALTGSATRKVKWTGYRSDGSRSAPLLLTLDPSL